MILQTNQLPENVNVELNTTKTTNGGATRYNHVAKLVLDYAVTLPSLLLLAPLFILLAVLVKLDSPGPIFHRRRVLGQNGRVFNAFKFRTMYVNGDEILARYPKLRQELNKNYKLKCDPRVTHVGKLLRKFSLDELPQLLNVLARDMSVIGPRIIAPNEISKYGPYTPMLMRVMPGLTGLWQVSGRSNTTYDERVALDMQYITKWSVWLDIKILPWTISVVLKGDRAC